MKPNILFIITHDAGPVYGCYGNPLIRTPNIDSLAAEGTRFDRQYCQWPLCGPSRASLFSGLYPTSTGRFDNKPFFRSFRGRAPRGFCTLPERFAMEGYRSFGAGWVYHDDVDDPSWNEGHYKPEPAGGPIPDWAKDYLDEETFFEWKSPEARDLILSRLRQALDAGHDRAYLRSLAGERLVRGPAVEAADVDDEAYYDGKVASRAVDFLDRREESRPYFLGVGLVAPHTPFRAPRRYWDLYDPASLPLPGARHLPEGSAEWMEGDSEPSQYYTTHGYTQPWRADEAQLRELQHGHWATISYIDALIGNILASARRRPDWENTVVVFTSDHGYSEGAHGYWGKHNLWDESLHVPMILRPAGGDTSTGRVVSGITEHLDVFPLLCEEAGLSVPEHCQGRRGLRRIIQEGAAAGGAEPNEPTEHDALSFRRPMWHDRLQVYDQGASLRTARYRYTEYTRADGEILGAELFDFQLDPSARKNHAGSPDYVPVRRELERRLKERVHESRL